jgi:hypothetical protein
MSVPRPQAKQGEQNTKHAGAAPTAPFKFSGLFARFPGARSDFKRLMELAAGHRGGDELRVFLVINQAIHALTGHGETNKGVLSIRTIAKLGKFKHTYRAAQAVLSLCEQELIERFQAVKQRDGTYKTGAPLKKPHRETNKHGRSVFRSGQDSTAWIEYKIPLQFKAAKLADTAQQGNVQPITHGKRRPPKRNPRKNRP